MPAELMGEHGGVKPVEGKIAPMDHFYERIEDFGLLSELVAKTKLVFAFV